MKQLVYYVACSVDGFLAHSDGSHDAFFGRDTDFDFPATLEAYDVVLMGRKTYELSRRLGHTADPNKRNLVFSRTMTASPDPHVEIVAEGAVPLVRSLKQESGKDIWLCGGSCLAGQLLAEGLIDEIVLKMNPVLFGQGVSLLDGAIPETELELRESSVYRGSYLVLRYGVKR